MKAIWWTWRLTSGRLLTPHKTRSLCAYLYSDLPGQMVQLIVTEEGQTQELPQNQTVEEMHQLAQDQVAAAVLAEREACAQLMADMRKKSRNHLFRSALTVAEGEIRARGEATRLPSDDTEGGKA